MSKAKNRFDVNPVCKAIRAYRDRLSLTQQELAERMKVAVNTVARWERGRIPDCAHIAWLFNACMYWEFEDLSDVFQRHFYHETGVDLIGTAYTRAAIDYWMKEYFPLFETGWENASEDVRKDALYLLLCIQLMAACGVQGKTARLNEIDSLPQNAAPESVIKKWVERQLRSDGSPARWPWERPLPEDVELANRIPKLAG